MREGNKLNKLASHAMIPPDLFHMSASCRGCIEGDGGAGATPGLGMAAGGALAGVGGFRWFGPPESTGDAVFRLTAAQVFVVECVPRQVDLRSCFLVPHSCVVAPFLQQAWYSLL